MQQSHVFAILAGERKYQDNRFNQEEAKHDVVGWIGLMQAYLNDALHGYVHGGSEPLDDLRKMIALGIACAEQHGLPSRRGYEIVERDIEQEMAEYTNPPPNPPPNQQYANAPHIMQHGRITPVRPFNPGDYLTDIEPRAGLNDYYVAQHRAALDAMREQMAAAMRMTQIPRGEVAQPEAATQTNAAAGQNAVTGERIMATLRRLIP